VSSISETHSTSNVDSARAVSRALAAIRWPPMRAGLPTAVAFAELHDRQPACPKNPGCSGGAHVGRLRAMHVIDSLGSGGAERQLVDLVLELHPDRLDSHVITLTDDHQLAGLLTDEGVPVESLGLPSFTQWPKAIGPLRGIIRTSSPDIVHTRNLNSDFAGRLAATGTGVPVLSSIESPIYSEQVRAVDAAAGRTWKRNIVRWLDIATSRASGATYVACAPNVAESAATALHVSPARMFVVPNSTHVPASRPALPPLNGTGPVRLIIVGKLSEPKGHTFLLHALLQILQRVPDVILQIVGSGPLEMKLKDEAVALGVDDHIEWAGQRNDVPQLLERAHLFVMSSLWEGLSIALLEAMAVGHAVVVTDIPAMRDVVTDGHDGILVPAADPAALATAVVELLEDPERVTRLRRRAWETARKYDVAESASALLAIYESVVS
jgi:glycosyltransferase involved in cell wall biosynthesis